MKSIYILCITTWILIIACGNPKLFHEVKVDNPSYSENTVFKSYEDLTSPKFKALKEKYQLDTILHGEQDELKRILVLRNWIRSVIRINDPGPHPGDGSCESILDHALKGYGYHCGHFMVVQNAVMNSFGYVTRSLGAGPGGTEGVDGHHGINEIWLNTYHKWFLSDAKYNHHFEKKGIPLSALEIRDEYLKNKAADVVLVNGPNAIPVEFDEEYKISKEHFARTYTWIEWDTYNDSYTPNSAIPGDRGILTMYEDDYFKKHTWIWDKKPHWAYHTQYMNLVSNRSAIEWTPNTIQAKVTLHGNKINVELHSNTPNFKTYEMQVVPEDKSVSRDSDPWKTVASTFDLDLKKDKNKFLVRTVNLAGVTGPEYTIVIER